MDSKTLATQKLVKQHLNAFVLNLGVEAIIADYDDNAVFITPKAVLKGKHEIRHFFETFLADFSDAARANFKLQANNTCGDMASIVWSVDDAVPMGTDTFVVRNNKIIQQTFAMYSPANND